MEFFRSLDLVCQEKELQEKLSLENLESYSDLLFPLEQVQGKQVKIGGIWGEFQLFRQEIAGGLRFALLDCPNALSWTLTCPSPPNNDKLIIHLTINRQHKDPEFIEEIEEFLSDHLNKLASYLALEGDLNRS